MAGEEDPPKSPALENDHDNDPFSEEDILILISSPNLDLMDLSFTQNPLPPHTPTTNINEIELFQEHPFSNSIFDTNNEFLVSPFDYDLINSWDMLDIPSDDHDVLGEISTNENGNNVGDTIEMDTRVLEQNGCTSMVPIPANSPTISEGILLCTYCNPLRGLVHTNGQEVMRLDIQGGIGYVCHAIIETQQYGDSFEPRHQTYHLMDLKMEYVKKFIEDYCAEREAGGFVITQDTNVDFYQAMNACSISNQSLMLTLPPHDDVLSAPRRDEPSVLSKVRKRKRTPFAAQRERTAKLTLKDMSMYFHLPIEEAARRLRLCPTAVKKICRKGGLHRWPHRKVKSLQKKVDSMKSVLRTATDVEFRAHAEQEIMKLEKKMNEICNESPKNLK